eukprot:410752_1
MNKSILHLIHFIVLTTTTISLTNITVDLTIIFDQSDSFDPLHPISINLSWKSIGYSCNDIFLKQSITNYQCNATQIDSITASTDDHIEIMYNSFSRIFIDQIVMWDVEENKKNVYYNITQFCVPRKYNYILQPTGQSILTTKRLNRCNMSLRGNTHEYSFQKFDNIAIGAKSKFIYHKINFIENIQNFGNKSVEAVTFPAELEQISIKITDLSKDGNPQTKDPIFISVIWFNKYYKCILYPTQPNETYSCNVNDISTEICDIKSSYYGKFNIIIEKNENLKDSLVIDHIYITDITNTYYGIDSFCIPLGLLLNSQVCGQQHHMKQITDVCDDYFDYDKSNVLTKCDRACIDSDYCWKNKLDYKFPIDVFLHPNESRGAKITSGVFGDEGPKCYQIPSTDNMFVTLGKENMVGIVISVIVNIFAMSIIGICGCYLYNNRSNKEYNLYKGSIQNEPSESTPTPISLSSKFDHLSSQQQIDPYTTLTPKEESKTLEIECKDDFVFVSNSNLSNKYDIDCNDDSANDWEKINKIEQDIQDENSSIK